MAGVCTDVPMCQHPSWVNKTLVIIIEDYEEIVTDGAKQFGAYGNDDADCDTWDRGGGKVKGGGKGKGKGKRGRKGKGKGGRRGNAKLDQPGSNEDWKTLIFL